MKVKKRELSERVSNDAVHGMFLHADRIPNTGIPPESHVKTLLSSPALLTKGLKCMLNGDVKRASCQGVKKQVTSSKFQ